MSKNQTNKISKELRNAHLAAEEGNEGLARVCARRAAGWAIRAWLNDKGVELNTPSAFEYIRHLKEQPDTPPKIKNILEHLTAKAAHKEGSDEHIFPVSIEVFIKEAHWLAEQMLQEKITLTEE